MYVCSGVFRGLMGYGPFGFGFIHRCTYVCMHARRHTHAHAHTHTHSDFDDLAFAGRLQKLHRHSKETNRLRSASYLLEMELVLV